MRLALGAGAEAHAGDAVATLDGDAVGGESPLVDEGTVALVHGRGSADALVAVERLVGVHQRLDVGGGFLVDPGGEEALGLIDLASPGGTVVHVHADLHVVAVLLHGGQVADLLEAGVPGLASGHAAVDGDGAGVGHGAAAGRGVENLGGGAGAAAEEAGVFIVLGVILGVEHLHETLDLGLIGVVVFVEGADVLENVGHFIDGVVAALGGGAVAGDALDVHADLHAAAVAAIDAAVGGLGGDDELGDDLIHIIDVLPAHAVAVLFLDGADHHDLVPGGDEPQVLHDLGAVDSGGHAALLVGAAAAIDDLVGFVALVGVVGPVGQVADAHGVDVGVDGDDLLAVAHPADDVAQAVDFHLVKVQLLHLGLDALDHALLLAALAGDGDHGAQKLRHVFLVAFGGCLDSFIIHGNDPPWFIIHLSVAPSGGTLLIPS